MEFLNANTSAGPLGFVGQIHTGRRRPCLLAVNGAFPSNRYLHDLVSHFFEVNVLVVNLPGMSGVAWSDTTPDALTRGLEEAVEIFFRDLPIVVLGVSTGNLLTLGLRLPNIRHHVAVEPFFQTKNLWPFVPYVRELLELNASQPTGPWIARFAWNYFGIGPDALENRDYRGLFENISRPTDVVVGQEPLLPERVLSNWPSFTSSDERSELIANPLVTLHEGIHGSGHGVHSTREGDLMVKRLLRSALVAAEISC